MYLKFFDSFDSEARTKAKEWLLSCPEGGKLEMAPKGWLECKMPDGQTIRRYIYRHPNGKLQVRGAFKNGKQDGRITYFREDGTLSHFTTLCEGQLCGLAQGWYPNSKQMSFDIENDADGNPIRSHHYAPDGREISSEEFDKMHHIIRPDFIPVRPIEQSLETNQGSKP